MCGDKSETINLTKNVNILLLIGRSRFVDIFHLGEEINFHDVGTATEIPVKASAKTAYALRIALVNEQTISNTQTRQ